VAVTLTLAARDAVRRPPTRVTVAVTVLTPASVVGWNEQLRNTTLVVLVACSRPPRALQLSKLPSVVASDTKVPTAELLSVTVKLSGAPAPTVVRLAVNAVMLTGATLAA
jgi:hypothetical protein